MAKLSKEERRAKLKNRAKNLAGADPTAGKKNYYFNPPAGIERWNVDEKGTRIIDLVTFFSDHDNTHYGLDKDGHGYSAGDEVYARYYGRHKIGGKWYVCPKSVDKECPVCDAKDKIWQAYNKSKSESEKAELKEQRE